MRWAAYALSRVCTEPALCVEPLSRCVLKVCGASDAYVWGPLYAGPLIASH